MAEQQGLPAYITLIAEWLAAKNDPTYQGLDSYNDYTKQNYEREALALTCRLLEAGFIIR